MNAQILMGFLLLAFASTRFIQSEVMVSTMRKNGGWMYLDRITFDKGEPSINLNIDIIAIRKDGNNHRQINLQFMAIKDQDWETAVNKRCLYSSPQKSKSQIAFTDIDALSNSTVLVLNLDAPTSYNFIVADCKKSLNNFTKRDSKIRIKANIKNGQSSIGQDERFYSYFLPFLLISSVLMLYWNISSEKNSEDTNFVKLIVNIALSLDIFAIFINYLGFLIYLSSQQVYSFFDFTYLLFHAFSESFIIALFLLISYGWTITHTNTQSKNRNLQMDLFIPAISMYGVINILLTMLSKIPDGSGKKYHLYDTIPSYILVILRIGLLFSMAYGIYCQVYPLGSSSSKRSQRTKTKDYKLINFLYYFVLLSFFYVLSVIIIIIVCKYVLPTERKHLAFFINELMKKGALFYFCFMLSSKVSMYKRIASSQRSFMDIGQKQL